MCMRINLLYLYGTIDTHMYIRIPYIFSFLLSLFLVYVTNIYVCILCIYRWNSQEVARFGELHRQEHTFKVCI